MMDKPILLDLFCGAGGAGMGYSRAGFEVVGVDMHPQKHFPFKFIQADALDYVASEGWRYDAIHASPPCQAHSAITRTAKTQECHIDLIPHTRYWLEALELPYVIENVPGAVRVLRNPFMLCGTMFGLLVRRHRYFESNCPIYFLPASCDHSKKVAKHGRPAKHGQELAAVSGHLSDIEYARAAMGIGWMVGGELSQAIPPAYTEWIGRQLMSYVLANRDAA
jgi:DNA (cytosine-5)-methyltransferase 1